MITLVSTDTGIYKATTGKMWRKIGTNHSTQQIHVYAYHSKVHNRFQLLITT